MLEHYLRALVSEPNRNNTEYWYESHAILRSKEEVEMFLGFLIPLTILDFKCVYISLVLTGCCLQINNSYLIQASA